MKNKQEETAIQKAPEAGALAIPIDNQAMTEMYGDMDSNDVTVPRIVVLQALSPEVTDGKGKPGELYVKGIERNLGSTPLEIIILLRNKSRIRWISQQLGGGTACRSVDAKQGIGDPGGACDSCPHSQWSVKSENPKGSPGCDVYQNLIVVLRHDEDWFPMALSGNRTKLKPMKNLNSLLMVEMQKSRPLFAKSYIVEVVKLTNKMGQPYHSIRFSPGNGNAVLPEADQKAAFEVFKAIRGKNIEIAHDQEVQTDGPIDE